MRERARSRGVVHRARRPCRSRARHTALVVLAARARALLGAFAARVPPPLPPCPVPCALTALTALTAVPFFPCPPSPSLGRVSDRAATFVRWRRRSGSAAAVLVGRPRWPPSLAVLLSCSGALPASSRPRVSRRSGSSSAAAQHRGFPREHRLVAAAALATPPTALLTSSLHPSASIRIQQRRSGPPRPAAPRQRQWTARETGPWRGDERVAEQQPFVARRRRAIVHARASAMAASSSSSGASGAGGSSAPPRLTLAPLVSSQTTRRPTGARPRSALEPTDFPDDPWTVDRIGLNLCVDGLPHGRTLPPPVAHPA